MIDFIVRLLCMSAAVYLIAHVHPGMRVKGFKAALVVSVVYGLLNFILFKVLILITFPIVLLKWATFGLFGVVINAGLLMLTDKVLDDLELSGFGAALLAALGIMLCNAALAQLLF